MNTLLNETNPQTVQEDKVLPKEPLSLTKRPRRLRRLPLLRDMVQETRLRISDFVMPLFFFDGEGPPQDIPSMPGIVRHNLQTLVKECDILYQMGVKSVMLFPCIESSEKDYRGSNALNPNGLIIRGIRAIKERVPRLVVMTDIALDPYTVHGHDGILNEMETDVLNDETVSVLKRMALLHAQAGADFVCPSDMMDGRVGAMRQHLDANGCNHVAIMSYTAKYASSFYGPFRDAVGSSGTMGREKSKATYQMNPANRREALLEAQLDADEGADILMIKPAGPFLDIIREVSDRQTIPVAAYQVSGEYAQLHAAARNGWLGLEACRYESLLSIKRAGANVIISYFTKDMAYWLPEKDC